MNREPMTVKNNRYQRLYQPGASEPFRLSRSKLELFLQCPRCFYLDRRLGVPQPPGFPFALNSAVDALLKKEFDLHRGRGEAHPLMKHYNIKSIPFRHEKMAEWRDNFKGVSFYHKKTNLVVFGAVDDIWQSEAGELEVVDYKATSTEGPVTLDAEYRQAYKRQMEIYQWLLRQNGFPVSAVGYFVYANGRRDRTAFDGRLEFEVEILPYRGDAGWVPAAIEAAHACLNSPKLPPPAETCEYCNYRQAAGAAEKNYAPVGTK